MPIDIPGLAEFCKIAARTNVADIYIGPDPVAVQKTPKRNDPCSCGSKRKYKKCCGKV